METSTVRLGDCILCNPAVKLTKGNQYSLIDIDQINVGCKIVTEKSKVVYTGQGGCKFENGDTLMARITPCLENGKMALAKIADKGIGSTELFVFRYKEGVTDKDFVYYLFKQQYLRNLAANSMTGASGRQRADLKFIKRIKLDLPSLPIQHRIASILSTYDTLIENNTKRIRLLETMAENLYKEWFVRFRFPGHENVEIEKGLPEGWKIRRYEDVTTISAGGDKPKICANNQTKECTIPIYSNGVDNDGLYGFTDEAKIEVPCITISARGTVGYVALRRVPFVPIVRLLTVIPDRLNVFYLYYASKNNDLEGNGTSQQQLTVPMLKKRKIIIPTEDICTAFGHNCRLFFFEIDNLQKQNTLLSRQRDLLLPRLMSGKLEVNP